MEVGRERERDKELSSRGFFLLAKPHIFILFWETDLPYLGSMMKFSEKLTCKV